MKVDRDVLDVARFIASSPGECVFTVVAPDNHVVVVIPPGVSSVFIGDNKPLESMVEQAKRGNRWHDE
jgi:hypothetical protein